MTDSVQRLSAALADRYVVERELGAGGMARVYLAHDVRHDRKVALKVLRPELSAILGGERFLHEIKTTANLQHPHILSLFDSGEADGTVFYVMPYVEGESLRERLSREKQLPVDEAVRIAREVADALQYAHERGIVHRDIKPENILLHGGHAMVADFGIALAASRSDGGTRMTETGMSLGTPFYMSPEQAMGDREITPRADIYALGCVLYEMLTAEPPFTGATAQAIIARVMTEEPRSLTLQRRTIPPHVEAAVHTALQKLPADRFASAAEFAAALRDPSFATTRTTAGSIGPRAGAPLTLAGRFAAVAPWALLGAALAYIGWQRIRPNPQPAPPAVYRFELALPGAVRWEDQVGFSMALSPDGTVLVFNGRDSAGSRLYVRSMGRLEITAINGSAGAQQPSFSPDGRWIGFLLGTRFVRVPTAGGPAETVCANATGFATWLDSSTGVIANAAGLRTCSLAGTISTLVPGDSNFTYSWPHVLPDRRAVLYTLRAADADRIAVFDLRTGVARQVGLAGSNPRYVAAGYLVYANQDGVIRAVPFDTASLAVTGQPVVVAEGVNVGSGGAAKMALSLSGTLVTALGRSTQGFLELVDRGGAGERQALPPLTYHQPRFSPDGRQIAVGAGSDIWLFDRRQGTLARLTFDSSATRPEWTRDGRHIVYVRQRGAAADLRIIRADGSAPAESLLTDSRYQLWQGVAAPDGRTLVVRSTTPSSRDIWRVVLDSTRALSPLLHTAADEVSPALSPDGHWMAYASNESGRHEVYVRSFPGMGARYQVSLDGGLEPVWSPRGGEIFYRNGAAMVAAAVRAGATFEVLGRTTLFTNPEYPFSTYEPLYDVAPDGRHFVMARRLSAGNQLVVTLNWFDHLRRAGAAARGAGQ
jgi:Tol biopolymer transport system component